jgi:hypothetical protein
MPEETRKQALYGFRRIKCSILLSSFSDIPTEPFVQRYWIGILKQIIWTLFSTVAGIPCFFLVVAKIGFFWIRFVSVFLRKSL